MTKNIKDPRPDEEFTKCARCGNKLFHKDDHFKRWAAGPGGVMLCFPCGNKL